LSGLEIGVPEVMVKGAGADKAGADFFPFLPELAL